MFVEDGERHPNLPAGADPLDAYALCAAACARSVEAQGHAFRLITNAAAVLRARYAALGVPAPALVEHRFTLDVPPIPFRAAHRKLELFAAFADEAFGPAVALIDIDTLLLRRWPVAIEPGVLQAYDITAQCPPSAIAHDLTWAGIAADRWWGGEFIAGGPIAFRPLADAVARLWPAYLAAVPGLRHVGDETVTTAALAGLRVRDVGGAGVQRWWSARTDVRPQASLRQAMTAALLHLPADKPLLGRYADLAVPLAGFPVAYRRHVAAKLPLRHAVTLAERLTGRPAKHVPRL